MAEAPTLSHFLTCLHNEAGPVGNIGRGAHYSVFRVAEWFDVERKRLSTAQTHDFAVIWDEDHDDRILALVEQIYMAGLLSPVQFIGERKGMLTVIVAAKFWGSLPSESAFEDYRGAIAELASNVGGDSWSVTLGIFDRAPTDARYPHQTDVAAIIQDSDYNTVTYLRSIDILWQLGTKPYRAPAIDMHSG